MPEIPNEKKDHASQQLSPQDKKTFSNLAKFLSRAFVQTQTFGIEHPMTKQPIERCFDILDTAIKEKGNIILYIVEKKLRYGNTILEEKNPVVDRLISLFITVQLVSLEFEKGFSREDFLKLLSIFAVKPDDIVAAGGVKKLVKEKQIGHLKINPIKYELIGVDEKVVSEKANIAEEALADLEKQIAKKEAQPEEKKSKEEEEKDKLLALIDKSLKEEADQSLFVDKLTENPLEVVNLIIEAIRMINKVGGENAKPILSSIINKLALVGDDLYRCLTDGKEVPEGVKETYKAAGTLGKELTKQIKNIKVAPELDSAVQEMTNVLTVLLDQIEAQKLLSSFLKGKITLVKKAKLLKKITQREKTSSEFGLMMKKLLTLKGMSEEEVRDLIDRKEEILKELTQEKNSALTQDLISTLQKLKDGQMDMDQAVTKLKEFLGKKPTK
ncbi:MAG: hypothetical protein NG712_01995 [Omnitrophica bacterium]|nr:hypothetical protein [Candidatus Omnitrophota bacterium]